MSVKHFKKYIAYGLFSERVMHINKHTHEKKNETFLSKVNVLVIFNFLSSIIISPVNTTAPTTAHNI